MVTILERPAGSAALIERHALRCVPPYHRSTIAETHTRRTIHGPDGVHDVYPPAYAPDDSDVAHLVFALKYDGADLGALRAAFERIDPAELEAAIAGAPTSKYLRRLWFLYERLTGRRLGSADATRGSYVDALDPAEHFTGPRERSRRHRVNDNLLGPPEFCPIVRRTPTLRSFAARHLADRAAEVVAGVDPSLIARAVGFLPPYDPR